MEAAESEHFAPANHPGTKPHQFGLELLRQWINQLPIDNEHQASRLCRMIPAQCPFERQLKIGGKTVLHIPPLCKLNPVYAEVAALRWRALCYLVDECGADISQYI